MHERDAGFSLVEALISTALTLTVVGVTFSALTGAARLTNTARLMSDTNQALEVGMSLMTRDFIQTAEALPRGGIPVPSGVGALAIKRPGPPGSVLTFDNTWTTLPAIVPGDALGPVSLSVPTDLVTVFYADPTLALSQWPLAAVAGDGSSATVDARTPITGPDGIKVGDLLLFSNAQGNAIQAVTRVSGGQMVFFDAGDPLRFNQRTVAQGTILNLQTGPGIFPPTTATRVLMVSYYLDLATDPTLPRLVRQVGNGTALAVALGTENLQFTFDLVDGVTNPSNVTTVVAPNSPNQIRKVNVFLAARSIDIDQRLHQFFRNATATDVALRSLSFVNRYK